MVSVKEGDRAVNRQRYTLEPLPTKVENFIRRLDRETQERINVLLSTSVVLRFDTKIQQRLEDYVGRRKDSIAIE